MKKIAGVFVGVSILSLLVGCSGEKEEKAKMTFEEQVVAIQQAVAEKEQLETFVETFDYIQNDVEQIHEKAKELRYGFYNDARAEWKDEINNLFDNVVKNIAELKDMPDFKDASAEKYLDNTIGDLEGFIKKGQALKNDFVFTFDEESFMKEFEASISSLEEKLDAYDKFVFNDEYADLLPSIKMKTKGEHICKKC
ncbi:MAG: hypothetical protein ACI35O_15735 [Bacillaceae bacterium]